MLRSVFTLFQNFMEITTSDRNNKPKLVKNSPTPFLINMDLELKGVHSEVKSKHEIKEILFKEQGDVHYEQDLSKSIKKLEKNGENKERLSYLNKKLTVNSGDSRVEVAGSKSKETLKKLIEINDDQCNVVDKGKDQLSNLLQQVNKMKNGLQRLQQIAHRFGNGDSFRENVDFLVKNIGSALAKSKDK